MCWSDYEEFCDFLAIEEVDVDANGSCFLRSIEKMTIE